MSRSAARLYRCPTSSFILPTNPATTNQCTEFTSNPFTFPASGGNYQRTVPNIPNQYIFARIPVSTAGHGGFLLSNAFRVLDPADRPDPPTGVQLTNNNNGTYTLSWTKPTPHANITGFDIHSDVVPDGDPLTGNSLPRTAARYAGLDLDNDAQGANCPGADTSCFYVIRAEIGTAGHDGNTNLVHGRNYFSVRARNDTASARSDHSSVATTSFIGFPYRLVEIAGSEAREVTWDAGAGSGAFKVYVRTSTSLQLFISNTFAELPTGLQRVSWTVNANPQQLSCRNSNVLCEAGPVPPLSGAGTYYFAFSGGGVEPRDGANRPPYQNLGGRDNPIVFPTVANPPAPTGLGVTYGASGVTLSWTKSANRHSRFTAYYKAGAGVATSDASIRLRPDCINDANNDATARACTATIAYADLTGIDSTTRGYFALEANINAANSALSSEATAAPLLPAPTDVRLTNNNDDTYTLSWTKTAPHANITGFDIHLAGTPAGSGVFQNTNSRNVSRYAGLDLDNDAQGANCPGADTACFFVIRAEAGTSGPGAVLSGNILGGRTYLALRARNASTGSRSNFSEVTTDFVASPYRLVEVAGAEAREVTWDADAGTGAFKVYITSDTSLEILLSNTYAGLPFGIQHISWTNIGDPTEFPCTNRAVLCEAGPVPPITGAGVYYFTFAGGGLPQGGGQNRVPHQNLGGRDNPIVFPTVADPPAPTAVTARHGADGVTLSWTKSANRHSRFTVYYKTSAGVATSDSSILLRPDCINDTNNDATARACTATIPYADLTGIDASTLGYFALEANINAADSELSAEAETTYPDLVIATTPRTLTFAQGATSTPQARTCESLPTVSGGGGTIVHAVTESLDWLEHRSDDGQQLCVAVGQQAAMTTAPDHETVTYTVRVSESPTNTASAEITVVVQGGLDTRELAKTALPDIVLAMADSTASGIKSRIGEVRRGCATATEFSLDGAQDFASIIQSQAEYEIHGNRNWRKMLGNSKFAVSHDGDSSDSGFCGVWGQGNFQNLDGEHSGVKWDGSLSGFALGADTRLGSGKLLGIAVNNQSGAFDVTKDATTSQYDVALSSVSPYLGWQSANGTDFHASLSVDSGEGEIKTSGNVTKHDLSGFGVGFGFRSSGKFKGDLVYSSVTADESVADGADISESIGVGRLRLAWERSRERVLASGASLNLNGEFGGRADTGTAGGGFGAELGFGFGYAKNSLKFGGNLRSLLFHSGDVGEFGAQIRLSIQPGQDGQGLSLSLTPTYGQTQSGLANLWENGISKITAVNPDSYEMRINAQLGYGLVFANAGLVTPYATANYGDVPQFGLGLNWKPKLRDLELDLLGEQIDAQQRILLKGTLGF